MARLFPKEHAFGWYITPDGKTIDRIALPAYFQFPVDCWVGPYNPAFPEIVVPFAKDIEVLK